MFFFYSEWTLGHLAPCWLEGDPYFTYLPGFNSCGAYLSGYVSKVTCRYNQGSFTRVLGKSLVIC